MIHVNKYVETAIKIKDTVSEFIPAKLSVIIKLAELAFDTFGKVDDSLNVLYKKAFKEAVENVATNESLDSRRKVLNNCKNINSLEDVQSLSKYLKKISMEIGVSLSKKDVLLAVESITEQFEYILLEDKYIKLYKLVEQRSIDDINNKFDQIKELLNEMDNKTYNIETDNKFYIKEFIKPLFRHKYETIITLKDVFIMPNLRVGTYIYNAMDVIRDFIKSKYKVLFIEGCGGYGKSSIVSFLAYSYFYGSSNDISVLENKQLIIVRLRNILGDNKIKTISDKLNLIYKYGIEKNAIIIFDGLDELCVMDKSDGSMIVKDIIKEFSFYERKIIITTRPTCINYSDINFSDVSFYISEICCFDVKQREKYADAYASKDKKHSKAVEYVKNLPLEKQNNESIYGSPFLLYLILSGDIKEEEKENSWLLMHRLFHDELFNPPYGYDRGIDNETAEIIYQFNCDIAYEMFKSQNTKLFITSEELKILLPNKDIKQFVKNSHGLFSYMRKSDEGAVEFVHNHIRDYFLCEKILREINLWYLDPNIDGHQITLNLGDMLMYAPFNNEVKNFINEALKYSKMAKTDKRNKIYKTLLHKIESKPLSTVFDWFYKGGGLIRYNLDNFVWHTYEKASYFAISNSTYIYKMIYEFHLNEGECIHWISDELLKADEIYFQGEGICYPSYNLFKLMRENLNKSYLKKARLLKIDFSNADLSYSNLIELNAFGGIFRNSKLMGAELTSAYLISADLTGSNLTGAKLAGAKLAGANLTDANLIDTDLTVVSLTGASLIGTNLTNSKLYIADLTSTNLTNANLTNANLTGSDLTCADLTGANLTGTNLSDVSFRNANLCKANLRLSLNIANATFYNTMFDDDTQFPYGFDTSKPKFKKNNYDK